MKGQSNILLFFIATMMAGMLLGWLLRGENCPVINDSPKVDTLLVRDTILRTEPFMVTKRIVEKVNIPVRDTITVRDTLYMQLDRDECVYTDDSTFYAVVSGIMPSLDTMKIYRSNRIITKTIVERVPASPSRWGVGAVAGYGLGKDGFTPYLGLGLTYQIISFK